MKKIESVQEVIEIIESGKYNYYGFRKATDHDRDVMDRGYLDCSYDWIDGDQTEDQLSGSCAVGINDYMNEEQIIERFNQCRNHYSGSVMLLIADNRCEYGNDDNEVILGSNGCGADVLGIVEI